jgi:ABC-type dipeptide/oligopeptide/nickel transport system permease subunit
MNETQWIFVAIASFGLGYFAGYLSKNISRIIDNLGCIVAVITTIILIIAVMQIVNLANIVISIIFALGFLFKLFKR